MNLNELRQMFGESKEEYLTRLGEKDYQQKKTIKMQSQAQSIAKLNYERMTYNERKNVHK